jgi:Signal peptide peptidase
MVQVSTVASRNPISIFTEALHLSMSPVRRLSLPGKIAFPSTLAGSPDGAFTMLGLGDIMLPSVLLNYLRDCDIALCSCQSGHLSFFYYLRALLAYAVAIAACFSANAVSKSAQPGLMYIVPALLIPTLILARARREFQFIWHGPRPLLDTDSTLAERRPLTR